MLFRSIANSGNFDIIAHVRSRDEARFKIEDGTAKAALIIAKPKWDLPLLADLSQVMRDASICGLGQAAPNPVDCVIKYFPHELA